MTETPSTGTAPDNDKAPYNPWGPGPEFTAKPPKTMSWHAWWAIPAIGLIMMAFIRPWEGAPAVVFSMKAPAWATAPSPKPAASIPKPGAMMPLQVVSRPSAAAAPSSQPASAPR